MHRRFFISFSALAFLKIKIQRRHLNKVYWRTRRNKILLFNELAIVVSATHRTSHILLTFIDIRLILT